MAGIRAITSKEKSLWFGASTGLGEATARLLCARGVQAFRIDPIFAPQYPQRPVKVCKDIIQTYEEQVEQTVEKWIEKTEEICEDLPWPLDWFCKVVTTLIKVVETVITTVIKTIITVVCYPVAFAITVIGEALQVAMGVPGIGPIVKAIAGGVAWAVSEVLGGGDAVAGLAGFRPIKHLRLHVIILMRPDRTLTVPVDRVGLTIQRAESIFRARADVKIHTAVHEVDTPSPRNALYVDSGAGLFGEEMGEAGYYFQTTITNMLWEKSPLFAGKIGAPVVAFIVDGVGTTTETGCSSGPLADYICIEGGQMLVPVQTTPVTAPIPPEPAGAGINMASTTLAHEMGHACGLLHDNVTNVQNGDPTNLMFFSATLPTGSPRGTNLSPFQRAIVRSSPHVTYI